MGSLRSTILHIATPTTDFVTGPTEHLGYPRKGITINIMLVIKIELHSAITKKVTLLGRMDIKNRGTGTEARGNYDVRVWRKNSLKKSKPYHSSILRRGEVLNYPRKRYNVWRLVIRALMDCFEEEGIRR